MKNKLMINTALVRHLITSQFPQWKNLPIKPVTLSGWDNRTFHLGEDMLIRMPSAAEYATQVDKEHYWLPRLAPLLPLPIPKPLQLGEPEYGYPWRWSIYFWIKGENAASAYIADDCKFVADLAHFLNALQNISAIGGPLPGAHNFYRGGTLLTYDAETRQAITALKSKIDTDVATEVWEAGITTSWREPPRWVHGDVSAGNLLVNEGKLSAVIDFGMLATGDPACDLTIAWTFFKGESREVFRSILSLDDNTWARARAWALWKALIIASGITKSNAIETAQSWHVISEVLAEYKKTSASHRFRCGS